ncbi:cyclase family protein [Arthrobacter oryzae]|uniref:Kynurenine formamidase n=1 Tax=Arthrobacter oryzae TaxID=409290 RepID=A0A495EW86_9MICC|nr:cyclase family protein [Arthrobacter oryzae]RKR20903.1 kynurenine formamidase [Arthrobacter oryzae]
MSWIDLSVPLHSGMPVYPGDPEVRITPALTVAADGANVLSLDMGTHSGTHADAPLHVDDAWDPLEKLHLAAFSGIAEVVDLRGAGGGAITASHLAGIRPAEGDGSADGGRRILVLHTGFSGRWGTPGYLAHPWLEAGAARLIVERGYRTVAIDALSVDPSTAGPAADSTAPAAAAHGFPAHLILAGNGCVIVENLTGLDRVQQLAAAGTAVEVFLFPLNIPGADGAPIRAVARPLPEPRQPGALSRAEVQSAAETLIAAFAANDAEAYFGAFAAESTFIFHSEGARLQSRAAYRSLWESWTAAGWRVEECSSSEQDIQLLGTSAVFSHRVGTTVRTSWAGAREVSDERETIVFVKTADGRILCVHEHLSVAPADI